MRLLGQWRRYRYLRAKYPTADAGILWRLAGPHDGLGRPR